MPKLLIFIIVSLLCEATFAKTIFYGPGEEVVPIYSNESTLLKFPLEVSTISGASRFEISPANDNAPSYSFLKLRPRFFKGFGDPVFVLSDQTVVRIKFLVSPKGSNIQADTIYTFEPRGASPQNFGPQGTGPDISGMELMKALIRGDEVSGYQAKGLNTDLDDNFKTVSVTLIRRYSGGEFNGYVYKIQNKSSYKKIFVNIKNLTLGDPNLAILSSIDHPLLDPKSKPTNQAFLRIVAKPVSQFSQLKLPTEIVERK